MEDFNNCDRSCRSQFINIIIIVFKNYQVTRDPGFLYRPQVKTYHANLYIYSMPSESDLLIIAVQLVGHSLEYDQIQSSSLLHGTFITSNKKAQ